MSTPINGQYGGCAGYVTKKSGLEHTSEVLQRDSLEVSVHSYDGIALLPVAAGGSNLEMAEVARLGREPAQAAALSGQPLYFERRLFGQ